MRKVFPFVFVLVVLLVAAVPAFANPGAPNFGSVFFADDQTWGTKGTTSLPAPNEHNMQSFDGLYAFTNGAEGQLTVAEAAPGNPNYNGGRWIPYTVTWNVEPELVTSYDQLMALAGAGDVTIGPAQVENANQCPLLPDKS